MRGIASKRSSRGFSLAEMLMAVAILLVLFGLGVPNLFRMQRSLRQKELDSKAEIIYIAAQNKMTKLRTGGNADKYTAAGTASGTQTIEDGVDDLGHTHSVTLSYMSYADLENASKAANAVMEPGTVEDELWKHQWIIEYQPDSGTVYGVFYSENKDKEPLTDYASAFSSRYAPSAPATLRLRKNRMRAGAWIGYYGYSSGSSGSELVETKTLSPTIAVTNEEKLTAMLRCSAPAGVSDLTFLFTLRDSAGNEFTQTYSGMIPWGNTYYVLVTLDDLSSTATRFENLYGQGSDHATKLLSGTALTLTLQVRSNNDNLIDQSLPVSVTTNSLFADSSTDSRADVKCCRHLQNLDRDSGLYNGEGRTETVITAKQVANLSFAEDENNRYDWYSYYSGNANPDFEHDWTAAFYNGSVRDEANFRPIRNSSLTEYDGGDFLIAGLNVDHADSAGLFEAANTEGGITYRNVNLTRSRVTGADATVGALVGTVDVTNVVMDHCRVYLDRMKDEQESEKEKWLAGAITGGVTGGLVGEVKADGGLTVQDSLASSVLRGTERAGGLIGRVAEDGSVALERSYADSYIYGADTGALVGGGAVASMSDCYAAGFQIADTSAAGLVNGTVNDAHRSYTISAMSQTPVELEEGEEPPEALSIYSTAVGILNIDNLYFMSGGNNLEGTEFIGSRTSEELATLLNADGNTAFTHETPGHSYPYNLMKGLSLDTYTYPRLVSNDHYGDWQAEFRPGALVYFEKYLNEDYEVSYGCYGAEVLDTLSASEGDIIVGDGYGIVYKDDGTAPDTMTVKLGERWTVELTLNTDTPTATIDGTEYPVLCLHTQDKEGVPYLIYTLPTQVINDTPASATAFYQKVEVTATNETDGISTTDYYYFNPHFAKTVGRLVKADDPVPALTENDKVLVRSPRHLYSMSLYYDDWYRDTTAESTFQQERNLVYTSYDWDDFYRAAPLTNLDLWPRPAREVPRANGQSSYVIDAQQPIGGTIETSFQSVYDGGCYTITDLSFKSERGDYIGMFGYNEGALKNIALVTEYDPESEERYLVQRIEDMTTNDHIYMGVLAGLNADNTDATTGLIENCAVAGYYVAGMDGTIHAYDNSKIYVGGLVGANDGTIRRSAADCPALRVSTVFAEGYIGGFVGHNRSTGDITDCYSIGHVEVAYARGGSVSIAGFAGRNNGTLSKDYCAVSLVASGDVVTSHGFAPMGGSVSGCSYLDQGTYTYVNQLRAYNSEADATSGESTTYKALTRQQGSARPGKTYSLYHPNTGDRNEAFPYRAVVRDFRDHGDHREHYVHYGDWQLEPVLGSLGIFYWEREQYGSNDGYHFTYIGTVEGKKDYGSSLCTAHDDGGVITEYGYGYYVQLGQEENVKIQSDGIAVSTSGSGYGNFGSYNEDAARELQIQMPEYQFYPYTTRLSGSDYVYLNGGSNDREGTWTLTYRGSEGEKRYEYKLAPFFANAMWRSNSGSNIVTFSGTIPVNASDGRPSDYSKAAGSEQNTYEVRSVEQLQYINWNSDTQDCSALVYGKKTDTSNTSSGQAGSGNYQKFPYLQYATVLKADKNNVQTKAAAEAKRPRQYWVQTHDLSGARMGSDFHYTPIAGMATSSPSTKDPYVNLLYAWFGGGYDGQSYKIQDLNIISPSYTVGLFGATAGADMKNVILYSSNGTHKVQRDTAGEQRVLAGDTVKFDGQGTGIGAYFVGGLVGLAYEYNANASEINNKISNCAISGYQIWDSSTNRQGVGTANVGGLIGLANVNLVQCSAVTEIHIDCIHPYGHNVWGSFVRTGGLAGAAGAPNSELSVKDCYTGGSIKVSERTQSEEPDRTKFQNGFAMRDKGDGKDGSGYSNNIFASGFLSGSYAPNISNFTAETGTQPTGKARIENCYTYLHLPDLTGNVRAVSLFANQADRYCKQGNIIKVNNCYYLGSAKESISYPKQDNPATWPNYFFKASMDVAERGNVSTAPSAAEMEMFHNGTYTEEMLNKYKKLVISEEEFEAMLNGDLTCLQTLLNFHSGHHPTSTDGTAESRDYSQLKSPAMVDALNNGRTGDDACWGNVTITEGPRNASVDGKYSFPSAAHLEGKNYPFPTVITQNDLTYGTYRKPVWVNVHYGAWPVDGLFWASARDSMDIFADMNDSGYAEKEFILRENGLLNGNTNLTIDDFAVSEPEGVVEIRDVTYHPNEKWFTVKLRALKESAVTVYLRDGIATGPSFSLEVTADLKVEFEPAAVEGFKNAESDVTLKALSKARPDGAVNYFSTDTKGTWTLKPVESGDVDLFDITQTAVPNVWKVAGTEAGTRTLEGVFSYEYCGKTYTAANFLDVKTYGVVGITDGNVYAETARSNDGATVETVKPLTEYPVSTRTRAPALPDEADVALYGTLNEGLISGGALELRVNGDLVTGTGLTENGSLFRVTRGELTRDNSFEYLALKVTYAGESQENIPDEVVLTAKLKDTRQNPNGGDIYYSFRLPLNHVRLFEAEFIGGTGARGEMSTMATFTDQPKLTLPACGFTKNGYSFAGWMIAGDETATVYQPGEELELTGDCTISAVWEPVSYQIRFDPNCTEYLNTDTGTQAPMENQTFEYDADAQALSTCLYARDGWYFTGWNTKANGKGTAYADGAEITNLTSAEEVVVLYAQWGDYNLTLVVAGQTYQTFAAGSIVGLDALPTGEGGYEMATVENGTFNGKHNDKAHSFTTSYELMGWYANVNNSWVQVLDAAGQLVVSSQENIAENGHFTMTEDCSLYALWEEHIWLAEQYEPNESKWTDFIDGISFSEGDYLEAVVDLTNCAEPSRALLSFGKKIKDFNDTSTIHMYYQGKKGSTPWQNRIRIFKVNQDPEGITGRIRIKFSGNEFKVYDADDDSVLLNLSNFPNEQIANVRALPGSMQIGCQESATQKNSKYEYIKFVRMGIDFEGDD